MPFAEVIYEPGAHSVVHFDNEDELKAALMEQHRRAITGEVGGPAGHNAERVTKVIVYNDHPGDLNAEGLAGKKALTNLVDGMASGTTVNSHQLIEAIRDEVSPVYPLSQGRHESMYKADGKELNINFLDAA